MEPITKIKEFSGAKLNNLEYGYFADQFLALMLATTAEKLHVDQLLVDTYGEKNQILHDISKQSRITDETGEVADIDKQTDDLLVSIFEILRSGMKSPVATRQKASTTLYNALKPYENTYRLPQRQEVQAVKGMLVDLGKENLATNVTTLGINDVVDALSDSVELYEAALEQRSVKQVNDLGNSQEVRKTMDELYDYITTVAFAFSVAEPSEELDNFVKTTNRLIDDARKAYNLRTGHSKPADDEKDPVVTDPTQKPQETPEITKFYPKEGANPDRPLDFPRNKTAVLEGKGLKLVDSPEGKKAQLVLINYVDQRMPHEDSAILLNTDEKIEFTMMYDAAEGQYNFQIETYPNGTEEVVIIKYPETITLV